MISALQGPTIGDWLCPAQLSALAASTMSTADAATESVFHLNGAPRPWQPDLTIERLLQQLDATGPGVAVERNEKVVRRAEHPETQIEPGDRIEVVRLVGGG